MSYLADFVKSLTDAELQVLKKLDVIGKEEEVRDVYVRNQGFKVFDAKLICQQLQITQTHFDKINSVLLTKVMYALYGNDYNRMFSGVLQKGLTALFFHELKIVERGVLSAKNKKEIEAFYRAAFDNLRSMFHPAYNARLTIQFGKKYLQSLSTKKTKADECYVEMMLLYGDILAAAFSGNDIKFTSVARKQLDKYKEKYYSQINFTSDFYIDFTEAAYYKHLTEDANGFVSAVLRAKASCNKSEREVQAKYSGVVLCELGFGLMCLNRFSEAHQNYTEAFQKHPDTIAKSFYHSGNYFATALSDKNYKSAEQIFNRYLLPRIQPATNRSVLFDIYFMGAWLHIHQNSFDEAAEYLTLLQQYKRNEITQMGQAMLRQLECTYFFLSADVNTATNIVTRNLRQLKKMYAQSGAFSYYYHYADCISQLMRWQSGSLRFPEKLQQQLRELPTGLNEVYNIPLRNAATKILKK